MLRKKNIPAILIRKNRKKSNNFQLDNVDKYDKKRIKTENNVTLIYLIYEFKCICIIFVPDTSSLFDCHVFWQPLLTVKMFRREVLPCFESI